MRCWGFGSYGRGSHSVKEAVAPGPVASAFTWELVTYTRPTESETLGVRPHNQCFMLLG